MKKMSWVAYYESVKPGAYEDEVLGFCVHVCVFSRPGRMPRRHYMIEAREEGIVTDWHDTPEDARAAYLLGLGCDHPQPPATSAVGARHCRQAA